MRSATTLLFTFMAMVVMAQEPVGTAASTTGRWGIGFEFSRKLVELFGRNVDRGTSLEGVAMYDYASDRSIRLGYRYHRYDLDRTITRSMRNDIMGTQELRDEANRHMFSLGHQWYFGNRGPRPFVGFDLLGGLHRSNYLDSWVSDDPQLEPSRRIEHNDRSLMLGVAAAIGLRYEPHEHLTVELRLSCARQTWIPIQGNAPDAPAWILSPPVGSGLYLQFRF